MKNTYVLATLLIATLLLSACTTQTDQQQVTPRGMEGMPCHQMPDGSWMGDCDNQEETTTQAGFLPADNTQETQFPPTQPTQEIRVEDTQEITLTADIVEWNVDGQTLIGYGYNQMIPGPTLRVQQGSNITVHFTNNLDVPTTIHWHGLRHDIAFDGVPGVSQEEVQPGESFSYELYFPDDGIYWYHPHVREDIQQEAGLQAAIIVEPTTAYNEVNQEEILILDDIRLEDNNYAPFGEEHANFAMMGRFGNTLLVNAQTNYEVEVQAGAVTRLYLLNTANVRPLNISIPGATMKRVGGDLGLYEQEEIIDSLIIAPAERYIVEVLFEEEQTYEIRHTSPHATSKLAEIHATSPEANDNEEFFEEQTRQEVQEDIAQFSEYFDKPVDYELSLTVAMHGMQHGMGGMMQPAHPIEWEDDMNMRMSAEQVQWKITDKNTQQTNTELEMRAQVGDVIKIRLTNEEDSMHPMHHPMHLHGQRFLITHIDEQPVNNKVWKDTVLVPVGASIDILVDVTNPGKWMIHCHVPEHMEAGMMSWLLVEE